MSHETDPRHRPTPPSQGPSSPRPSKGHTSHPSERKTGKTASRLATGNEPARGGDERKRLGAEGERRAAWYLRRRGYRILACNVRCEGVELDLIAQRGPLVAFVEVKTRRTARFGSPEQAVDGAKQARIVRGAAGWLRANPGTSTWRVRFDVMSCRVGMAGGREAWAITHIADAFRAGD